MVSLRSSVRLVLEGPELLLRALDDLHTLAQAAATLPEIEERLTERMSGLEDRVDLALERASTLDRIERRAGEVIALARRIEQELPDAERAIAAIDRLGTASQTLAQAVMTLQSAGERVGRLTDLLPGGRHSPLRSP